MFQFESKREFILVIWLPFMCFALQSHLTELSSTKISNKIHQTFENESGVTWSRLTVKELQMNVTCVACRVAPFRSKETFKTIAVSVFGILDLFQIHENKS